MNTDEMRTRAEADGVLRDAMADYQPGEGGYDDRERAIINNAKLIAADVLALIAENERLEESHRAQNYMLDLIEKSHSTNTVDDEVRQSGPLVHVVGEVLLGMLRVTDAPNLVSFKVEKGPDDLAIVTVQRPTGKTPIELLRAAGAERDALRLEVERLTRVERFARKLAEASPEWRAFFDAP